MSLEKLPIINDIKLTRFASGRRPCLDILPDDIIVDVLFDLIEVEDILCMRRVSLFHWYDCFMKSYYSLG